MGSRIQSHSPQGHYFQYVESTLCSTVSSERPYWHGLMCWLKRGSILCNQALVHFGAGGAARGGWGGSRQGDRSARGCPSRAERADPTWSGAKSVGWHFSTTISTEIIKHCVGNPEQHPSCSVCRWNPPCVQVPVAPPARPLSPPDSILLRLYPCAIPPRWGSRAINAKCALLLG